MRESEMYGPIWRGANEAGWSLFRIADGSVGKKPGDIAGLAFGVAVLIEAKIVNTASHPRPTTQAETLPTWSVYECHQIAWLTRYAEANALAIAMEHDDTQHKTRAFILSIPGHFAENGWMPHVVDMYKKNGVYAPECFDNILHTWRLNLREKGLTPADLGQKPIKV